MKAAVNYGRMNPPHIGHEKLIKALGKVDADKHILVLSTKHDKSNPLDPKTKLEIIKKIGAPYGVTVYLDNDPSIKANGLHGMFVVPALDDLKDADEIVYVVGEDRAEIAMAGRLGKSFADKKFSVTDSTGGVELKRAKESAEEIVANIQARSPMKMKLEEASGSLMRYCVQQDLKDIFTLGMAYERFTPNSALVDKTFDQIKAKLDEPEEPKPAKKPRATKAKPKAIKESILSFADFTQAISVFQEDYKSHSNILTEDVNAHSTHIEELCFTKGYDGLVQSVVGINYIAKHLGKKGNKGFSIKFDGAPAIFFGTDASGNFFVATKNLIASKKPQLYYKESDVDEYYGDDKAELKAIIKSALKNLKPTFPKVKNVIIQGDIMFCADEESRKLEVKDLEGTSCYMFRPNTIGYAVPVDSELGKIIKRAKIGVVIHTLYDWDGEDPTTIKKTQTSISVEDSGLIHSAQAFVTDAVNEVTSNEVVKFGVEEYLDLRKELIQILRLGKKIDWSIIKDKNEISQALASFINTYIRDANSKPIQEIDPKTKVEDFFKYVDRKHQDALHTKDTKTGELKLKGPKGQATANAKFAVLHALQTSMAELEKLFEVFNRLTNAKLRVIKQLDSIGQFKKFIVVTSENGEDNYKKTNDEGYVLTATKGQGAKLVDRNVFSANNFNRSGKSFGS